MGIEKSGLLSGKGEVNEKLMVGALSTGKKEPE